MLVCLLNIVIWLVLVIKIYFGGWNFNFLYSVVIFLEGDFFGVVLFFLLFGGGLRGVLFGGLSSEVVEFVGFGGGGSLEGDDWVGVVVVEEECFFWVVVCVLGDDGWDDKGL